MTTVHSLKGYFQKFWQLMFVNDGNGSRMEHTYDSTTRERGETLSRKMQGRGGERKERDGREKEEEAKTCK